MARRTLCTCYVGLVILIGLAGQARIAAGRKPRRTRGWQGLHSRLDRFTRIPSSSPCLQQYEKARSALAVFPPTMAGAWVSSNFQSSFCRPGQFGSNIIRVSQHRYVRVPGPSTQLRCPLVQAEILLPICAFHSMNRHVVQHYRAMHVSVHRMDTIETASTAPLFKV